MKAESPVSEVLAATIRKIDIKHAVNLPMLKSMVELQLSLQNEYNRDWLTKNWAYPIAKSAEIIEYFDHIGWKWWRNTEREGGMSNPDNLAQALIELVDILHFEMSDSIQQAVNKGHSPSDAVIITTNDMMAATNYLTVNTYRAILTLMQQGEDALTDTQKVDVNQYRHGQDIEPEDFNPIIEIHKLLETKYGALTLLLAHGQTVNDVYRTYLGKNVLNTHRINNGYKDRTYNTQWPYVSNGEIKYGEDNAVLEIIVANMGLQADVNDFHHIAGFLQEYYYDFVQYDGEPVAIANSSIASIEEFMLRTEGTTTDNVSRSDVTYADLHAEIIDVCALPGMGRVDIESAYDITLMERLFLSNPVCFAVYRRDFHFADRFLVNGKWPAINK